jgi:hypothetical protein
MYNVDGYVSMLFAMLNDLNLNILFPELLWLCGRFGGDAIKNVGTNLCRQHSTSLDAGETHCKIGCWRGVNTTDGREHVLVWCKMSGQNQK